MLQAIDAVRYQEIGADCNHGALRLPHGWGTHTETKLTAPAQKGRQPATLWRSTATRSWSVLQAWTSRRASGGLRFSTSDSWGTTGEQVDGLDGAEWDQFTSPWRSWRRLRGRTYNGKDTAYVNPAPSAGQAGVADGVAHESESLGASVAIEGDTVVSRPTETTTTAPNRARSTSSVRPTVGSRKQR